MFRNIGKKKRSSEDGDRDIVYPVYQEVKDFFHELKVKFECLMDLEEFQKIYVPKIDDVILKEEGKNDCRYLGGEFKIRMINDDQYECAYVIYFSDGSDVEKIHSLSAKSELLPCTGLTDDLTDELKKEDIIFNIEEPSKESRKRFYESGK